MTSSVSCDDIALLLGDDSSFLAGVEALRANMTGPPTHIFTVPMVWPLLVALGARVGPKMREPTLDAVAGVLTIASDLYALSVEQRAALDRYRASIATARETRLALKATRAAKAPAPPAARRGGRAPRARAHEDTQSPDALARAARQAELFAQHDMAFEQVRATLCHHPLRRSGELLLASDMRELIMGDVGGKLRVGQLVAVPRSTGGLCYGEVVGPVAGTRCYWHPSTEHAERLVSVQYATKQKRLPSSLLGRLSPAPGAQLAATDIEGSLRPQVGDSLAGADAPHVLFASNSKFGAGELVAVARSHGGFTVGRVEQVRAMDCPSGHRHPVAAVRVVTDEGDDEGCAKAKLVAAGLVGKLLSPWAAEQRRELATNAREAATDAALMTRDDDDDLESKLRERFGDFTPFLDDEEADDGGLPLDGELETPTVVAGGGGIAAAAAPSAAISQAQWGGSLFGTSLFALHP